MSLFQQTRPQATLFLFNNVVCRLLYINTLKQELDGTRAYQVTASEVSVVNAHLNELPFKVFCLCQ